MTLPFQGQDEPTHRKVDRLLYRPWVAGRAAARLRRHTTLRRKGGDRHDPRCCGRQPIEGKAIPPTHTLKQEADGMPSARGSVSIITARLARLGIAGYCTVIVAVMGGLLFLW